MSNNVEKPNRTPDKTERIRTMLARQKRRNSRWHNSLRDVTAAVEPNVAPPGPVSQRQTMH